MQNKYTCNATVTDGEKRYKVNFVFASRYLIQACNQCVRKAIIEGYSVKEIEVIEGGKVDPFNFEDRSFEI